MLRQVAETLGVASYKPSPVHSCDLRSYPKPRKGIQLTAGSFVLITFPNEESPLPKEARPWRGSPKPPSEARVNRMPVPPPATETSLFSSLYPPPLPGRPSQEPLQRGPALSPGQPLGRANRKRKLSSQARAGKVGARLSLPGPGEPVSWRSPPPVSIWKPEGFGLWLSGTGENLPPPFPHHAFRNPKAFHLPFGPTSDLYSRDLEAFSDRLTRWGGLGSWVGSGKELGASLGAPRDPQG